MVKAKDVMMGDHTPIVKTTSQSVLVNEFEQSILIALNCSQFVKEPTTDSGC